ncbi:hypothetical protein EVG20_g5207 [Dentipellis fragilis]|uniref:CBS domain-containing protein n=1 Tax=Dentipellis fragilis TaxID=205917 RepID=A0A4Y9YUK4_9AGAM|nr:hypothetical protein EVG20_g5207 [Dentipellis fragilis]
MTVATTSAPSLNTLSTLPPADKYRGAVDLQLPPAFALPQDDAIARAMELAFDRDFSHIPVLDRKRKPLGYLDVPKLKSKWEAGELNPSDPVSASMTKFNRSPTTNPYTTITPATPLAELEHFLATNIFALVTDYDRKFVLAVATPQDLENFVTRRGH